MALKPRGLGRGLDALLGDASSMSIKKDKGVGLKTLPIEFLQRGKYQPRKDINPEALTELADSITSQGIIQPIVVRSIAENKYEIIAGERRWRAAQMAKLTEIPVVIKEIDDRTAMAIALIENIQREDLNALEESEALKRLVDEFGMTHQQVANTVGKSRAMVSNLLRLLDLETEVKTMLSKGLLEMGHARALLALEGSQQIKIAAQVAKQGLTVRATEKLIKQATTTQSPKDNKLDADTLRLQNEISERTGAKVIIKHKKNGQGALVFNYTSLEELEGIVDRIQ